MPNNISPNDNTSGPLLVEAIIATMFFCRPGIIEEFDPETNLAKCRCAIQAKISLKGKVEYRTMPIIVRVPVIIPFAQVAGLCLTLPLQKGDECTLLFSDRFIDNFVNRGGIVPPESAGVNNQTTEIRMHSQTDAICLPGIISQPNRLPAWNTEAIELRDKNRETFISLGKDKSISISAPGGVTITSGKSIEMRAEENITSRAGENIGDVAGQSITWDAPYSEGSGIVTIENLKTRAGFDANAHRHSGVEPGGGTSGTFA